MTGIRAGEWRAGEQSKFLRLSRRFPIIDGLRWKYPPQSMDAPDLPTAQSDDTAIFSELARLNTPNRSWGKPLIVFVVTLFLFSVTGQVQYSDPVFLGMLVGVLFFHEAGHFVAMRLFGYRNVSLFFIPFFGAAVTGRTFLAAGWKKAVVSLMGPLPGIVVGTVMLAPLLMVHVPQWIPRLGILSIFLNLFNLLPLQPLDGGRFLNALIFCRNHWLEAAFRVLTGALLGLIAWKLQSFLLGLVAFFVIFSTAVTYQAATIASRLRDQLPQPDPASDEIPREAAETIIHAVQAEIPRLKTSKQIAVVVQNIYEAATLRRPSLWPSVGLLLLYPILFLLPVAPWAAFAIHDPARFHAWRARVHAARAARPGGDTRSAGRYPAHRTPFPGPRLAQIGALGF